jgi:L-seryl-tRNA(Ser) seleniumtransferase
MTLAALIATLELYRDGRAESDIPVWRMIATDVTSLEHRGRAIVPQLSAAGIDAAVIATQSTVGGGSLPEETQPSRAVTVAVKGATASALAARLRSATPAIVSRIVDGRVALDLRAVSPDDDELLSQTVITALAQEDEHGR